MTSSLAPEIPGHEFVSHLGEGGYSDVYLYERRSPRMRVAVKVLKDGRLSPSELAQFEAEAETMAELADHPYIVQVFSSDTTADGRPFLIMKFYPQPNLGKRAAAERFSVAETLRTGVKLASAVETAHRAGILHRDIKPANVLVSQYGEPGLTDFGIAGRAADADDADDIGVSIPWSPPEVLTGQSNGSAQSDVYSLAATLWHLLVGRSPFEVPGGDNSAHALMQRVIRTAPSSTGRADVPAALDRLLQQAMAKNPAVRPRTALEFAQALQGIEQELRLERTGIVVEVLGDAAGGARPPAPPDTTDRTRMRAPTRVDAQRPRRPRDSSSRFAPGDAAPPAAPAAVAPRVTDPPGPAPTAGPTTAPTTVRPQVPVSDATGRRTAADDSPRTRARPLTPGGPRTRAAVPGAEREATTRRPVQPVDAPVGEAPAKSGVRRSHLLIAAAAALIVVAVVGVILDAGGSTRPHTDPSPSVDGANTVAQPPGQPVVTASYDSVRHAVTFSWTYDGAKAGDYFEVAAAIGAPRRRVDVAHITIPTTKPAATCLIVAAFHAGDDAGSTPSDPKCGP